MFDIDREFARLVARTFPSESRRSFLSRTTRSLFKLVGASVAGQALLFRSPKAFGQDTHSDWSWCGLHGYTCTGNCHPSSSGNSGTLGNPSSMVYAWQACCKKPATGKWHCVTYADYCGTRGTNWGSGCSGSSPSGSPWCGGASGSYICTDVQVGGTAHDSTDACASGCQGRPSCGRVDVAVSMLLPKNGSHELVIVSNGKIAKRTKVGRVVSFGVSSNQVALIKHTDKEYVFHLYDKSSHDVLQALPLKTMPLQYILGPEQQLFFGDDNQRIYFAAIEQSEKAAKVKFVLAQIDLESKEIRTTELPPAIANPWMMGYSQGVAVQDLFGSQNLYVYSSGAKQLEVISARSKIDSLAYFINLPDALCRVSDDGLVEVVSAKSSDDTPPSNRVLEEGRVSRPIQVQWLGKDYLLVGSKSKLDEPFQELVVIDPRSGDVVWQMEIPFVGSISFVEESQSVLLISEAGALVEIPIGAKAPSYSLELQSRPIADFRILDVDAWQEEPKE
jgi:hypothetical protein